MVAGAGRLQEANRPGDFLKKDACKFDFDHYICPAVTENPFGYRSHRLL
jgi:hypothetical protein